MPQLQLGGDLTLAPVLSVTWCFQISTQHALVCLYLQAPVLIPAMLGKIFSSGPGAHSAAHYYSAVGWGV